MSRDRRIHKPIPLKFDEVLKRVADENKPKKKEDKKKDKK